MSKLNTFGKKNFWDLVEVVVFMLAAVFLAVVFVYAAYQGEWGFCASIIFLCYLMFACYKVLSSRGPWTGDNWAALMVHTGNCFLILGIAMFTYQEETAIRAVPFVAMAISYLASWIFNEMYLEMLNHPSLMNWNTGSNFDQLGDFMAKNNLELVGRLEKDDKLIERDGKIFVWRSDSYTIQEVTFRWDYGFLVKK